MSEKHGDFMHSIFPPRLLVLAFSFLSSTFSVLLAASCFVLALDKRTDPNGAVSLPGNQKFATFLTAGIFLIVLPISLIILLSTWVHTCQRYSPSNPNSRSKVHELVTLHRFSLSPAKPFFLFSSRICRALLSIGTLVQLVDIIAFAVVIFMRQNDICLFGGRVVLCNLLTRGQKVFIIAPAFVQILAQIALFFLLKPYTRALEAEAQITSDLEIFAPISTSLKGGSRSQGPFQMVPVFDPDHDLEKDGGDFTESPSDRPYDPAYDYSTPYDDPVTFDGYSGVDQFKFPKQNKLSRSMSTYSSSSQMQGPRPAPKRSGTLSPYPPPVVPASPPASSPKGKEWFKRFKSKTLSTTAIDEGEVERLVPGRFSKEQSNISGRK